MVCANIETKKRYNYKFVDPMSVEISDIDGNKKVIKYHDWCKHFYIIDKWRDLNKSDTLWET